MIQCCILRSEQTSNVGFEFHIEGDCKDIIAELIRINGALIQDFRKAGIKEEEIEKQLVLCIKGGFDFANGELKAR